MKKIFKMALIFLFVWSCGAASAESKQDNKKVKTKPKIESMVFHHGEDPSQSARFRSHGASHSMVRKIGDTTVWKNGNRYFVSIPMAPLRFWPAKRGISERGNVAPDYHRMSNSIGFGWQVVWANCDVKANAQWCAEVADSSACGPVLDLIDEVATGTDNFYAYLANNYGQVAAACRAQQSPSSPTPELDFMICPFVSVLDQNGASDAAAAAHFQEFRIFNQTIFINPLRQATGCF